jgi:hypothetical protein
MRHIKLFEGFEKSEYYQEIDSDDFVDELNERVDMSNVIINRIGELLSGWDIDVDNLDIVYAWDENRHEIKIFEVSDEYYYIYINNYEDDYTTYWKCDQFEGLEELLKDKGIVR